MTALEQPTSAQIAMKFDSPAQCHTGIAKAIVEQSGGIAAFTIIVDVVPLGIPLSSISGFKEPEDTSAFFLAHRETLMGIVKEIAVDRSLTPEHYFMALDDTLNIATAKELYKILSEPELLGVSSSRMMAAYYGLIHKISLQVVIKVINDIYTRRSAFPF